MPTAARLGASLCSEVELYLRRRPEANALFWPRVVLPGGDAPRAAPVDPVVAQTIFHLRKRGGVQAGGGALIRMFRLT